MIKHFWLWQSRYFYLLHVRHLSFALIVQGLAKKYRSEARMIFSANQSEGQPCASEAKGYLYM
ncbi:hypothetical protein POY69_07220 [Phocaeicola vulgatus]|nr:hypothetical protein [Phocaeicola vulgatus]